MRKISIKSVRKANHLTQMELAEKLKVKQSAVSMWETGYTEPRLDKLKAMAALFNCTVDELLTEDE